MKNKYLIFSIAGFFACVSFFLSQYFNFQESKKQNISAVEIIEYPAQATEHNPREHSQGRGHTASKIFPYFRAPNIEWKARTITLDDGRTLIYEFGKGNPIGADPLSSMEVNSYASCDETSELTIDICGKMGEEVFGYVTPDVENSVMKLISNPIWERVLMNCEANFRRYESDGIWGTTGERTYDQVFYGGGLDIENMFSINRMSGRKELKISDLRQWFTNVYRQGSSTNSARDILSINNCLSQNGGLELYRQFDTIYQQMMRPY